MSDPWVSDDPMVGSISSVDAHIWWNGSPPRKGMQSGVIVTTNWSPEDRAISYRRLFDCDWGASFAHWKAESQHERVAELVMIFTRLLIDYHLPAEAVDREFSKILEWCWLTRREGANAERWRSMAPIQIVPNLSPFKRMAGNSRGLHNGAKLALARKIADRDGWVCGICKLPIEAGDAIHIDHKIPKSMGGNGDFDNMQLAHYHCNMAKSNLARPPAAVAQETP
jgi:hypothetical protein